MKSILICDDEKDFREMISEDMEYINPQSRIITAKSLDEAVKLATPEIAKDNLGIIFTDGQLKPGHGYDLLMKLKDIGYKGPAVYIGLSTPEDEDKLKAFTKIIRKAPPINYGIMAEYAKSVLNMYENQKTIQSELTPQLECYLK